MRIGVIIIGLAFSATAWGQGIDEDRMDKDLEVGENVLSAMLKQESDWPAKLLGGVEVEGEYIDDYGVVFEIESNSWFSNITGYKKDCDDCDEEKYVIAPKVKVKDGHGGSNSWVWANDSDSAVGSAKANIRNIMQDFLVDYADLIGQLRPSDHIMVKHSSSDRGFEIFTQNGKSYNKKGGGYLTAEVLKGDINDYKSKKINKEQLIKKIRFEESDGSTEKEADLELLASIFNRLYKSDLSETYFISQGPEYERVKGLGVVYHMKVYSSYEEGDRFRMPTIGENGVTNKERSELVKEIYPEFVSELKENMVVYGRTLKTLSDDESLIFKIKMTRCIDCGLPDSMDFAVKGSVLKNYDSNKINLEAAVKKVSLKEH